VTPAAERLPPCFVISTGRCGSTFVSDILVRHPRVLSISEFFWATEPQVFPEGEISGTAFAEKLSRRDPLVTAALRARAETPEFRYPVDDPQRRFDREDGVPMIAAITLPHLADDPDALYDEVVAFAMARPAAGMGAHYAALFEWLRERFDRDLWVERTGGSLQFVPQLVASVPDAVLIHLYRDGRETAISMSKRENFRLMFAGVEMQRLTGIDPYTMPDAPEPTGLPYPLSHLLPSTFDVQALKDLEVPIERFGLHWSSSILRGLRQLRTIDPGRLLSISYEELVTEPARVVEEMSAFLGIEAPAEWISWTAGAARRQPSNWLRLPEPERERLDAACRIANKRLYGPDGPPVFTAEAVDAVDASSNRPD
jgi:putative sulfotransferase